MFRRTTGGSLLVHSEVRRKITVAEPRGIGELRRDRDFLKLQERMKGKVTIHVLFPGAQASDWYTCSDSDVIEAALKGVVTPTKLIIESQRGSEFDFNANGCVGVTYPRVMLEVSGGSNSPWITPREARVLVDGRFTQINLDY